MIRRSIFLLSVTLAVLFTSCEKWDHAIADIEDRLDKIEGTKITSIEQQITAINTSLEDLKAVDAALQKLIDDLEAEAAELQKQLDDNAAADAATKKALEDEIANIKALIAELQAKDAELDQKIADLQTYVDSEITATEDWANATFATLTQYEGVQTEIAAIKALIEQYNSDVTAEYTAAIEKAIADSETSMKTWVNELLAEGYYDIAAIDAKLAALETNLTTADVELKKQIEDQQSALEQAKKDLTAAYEKAIADAIETNNGIINAAIAKAVQDAIDAVDMKLESINDEINSIKNRLTELENNFANRIQSLTYIPKHTDGKATMTYDAATGKSEAELDFFVTPKSVIESIKAEHLAVKATYTVTRAASLTDLTVTGLAKDATNGTITVKVSGENLSQDFFNGTADVAIFLIISDGNNEFVSGYVQLMPKEVYTTGTFDATNMTAGNLKTYVTEALNKGIRDFSISGNLTEEQQKAVGTALNDWCHEYEGLLDNPEGQGTVSLTLPDVIAIADRAFRPNEDYGGSALKCITLPNTTVIGEYAFDGQNQLQSIIAPKVTEVKTKGLYNCDALTDVQMPNITTVGKSAFAFTGITTFSWDNLQSIGVSAFSQTSIGGVISLPNITSIEIDTFQGCSNLTGIIAPKVTTIGHSAFAYCPNLIVLTFGTALTSVSGQVLHNGNQPSYTENITLTLAADQKVLSGGDNTSRLSVWTVADGAATVEFGENKTFCGYTFKEIKFAE